MTISDAPSHQNINVQPADMPAEPKLACPQYRPVSAVLALALDVSVVIPVKNEAANLPHVFRTIPEWVQEVILVDGKSTDNTVEVALQLRPDIKVVTQQGAGKGDALLDTRHRPHHIAAFGLQALGDQIGDHQRIFGHQYAKSAEIGPGTQIHDHPLVPSA